MICPLAFADFDDGMTAYRSGDFKRAFDEFHQLAIAGHETAQFNLGVLYYRGEGTKRDLVKALGWIELSTQHGDADNIKAQEILIFNMEKSQIQEAYDLAANLAKQHKLHYRPPDLGNIDSRIAITDIR